jgi:hypothetical protein
MRSNSARSATPGAELESVNPAFRNSTIADLVTLPRRSQSQAETTNFARLAYGIREAAQLIEHAPCPILERVTQDEAE